LYQGSGEENKPVNPKALGGTKQAAKWESGIDNGPVFDDAYFNEQTHQMELADTGLMGMYVADANALAEMADILDRKQDAEWLLGSAQKYSEKLATLWTPAAGIFLDKNLRENSINALLRRVSIQCFPKLQHLTKLTKC
jgi:putative isomerase